MINIKGGPLWQWSIGRQVIITPKAGYTVNKVEFANRYTDNAVKGEIVTDYDGTITTVIPAALLQHDVNLTVYAVCVNENFAQTTESVTFIVNGRAKPIDYIYTADEVREYQEYDERLSYLESNLEEFAKTDFGAIN